MLVEAALSVPLGPTACPTCADSTAECGSLSIHITLQRFTDTTWIVISRETAPSVAHVIRCTVDQGMPLSVVGTGWEPDVEVLLGDAEDPLSCLVCHQLMRCLHDQGLRTSLLVFLSLPKSDLIPQGARKPLIDALSAKVVSLWMESQHHPDASRAAPQ